MAADRDLSGDIRAERLDTLENALKELARTGWF